MRMLRRAPPTPARPTRTTKQPTARSFLPTNVGKNVRERFSQFLFETRSELRKVVWPTRAQAINLTGLVIGVSIAVSIFVGVVDIVLQKLVQILSGG